MSVLIPQKIANELNLAPQKVNAVIDLLQSGATVPFIARYRKEVTGSLDEVFITQIRDREQQLKDLESRRETILKTIEEQGNLTPELRKKILNAESLSVLEDIYLPFKPKRRTRGMMAKEKGLEPLAQLLIQQKHFSPEQIASDFVNKGKGVGSIEEALDGARDIIAEWVNESPQARARMRKLFEHKALMEAKVKRGKDEEGEKYKDYFEWAEPIKNAPSHRILAIRRGEKEGILSMKIAPEMDDALNQLDRIFVEGRNGSSEQVEIAIQDSYKRLLQPSMETEMRMLTKQRADEEAIKVFAENLRQLLLAAPLGQKRMLAVDPGFRTGCKVVALDEQGQLLKYETIFPHPPVSRPRESEITFRKLVDKFRPEAIAVGNGTAGRETQVWLQKLGLDKSIQIVLVNESGASIYSASAVAREEFPDYDLTVRGSVSIGRRLMDPLAELVKLDPKSIGVGQYQHDVDQNLLKQALTDVVVSCVNAVGVEVNTASKELLSAVSGLGPTLAKNMVEFRNENGPFKSRSQLKKVPRLGDKAFEQAAGFLRIKGAKNPLDESAVHPESYPIVDKMAKDLGVSVGDLVGNAKLVQQIRPENYVSGNTGLPTLKDILTELAKPGRDPREKFEEFSFAEGINEINDLHEGMIVPGIVTNITRFGAFVDIGVHQDGLVHVSEMANRFIKDPAEVVKVAQKIQVKVMEVDIKRKRIALSMKQV